METAVYVSFNWWEVYWWLPPMVLATLVLTVGYGTPNYLIFTGLWLGCYYESDLLQSSPERAAAAFQRAFLARDYAQAKQLAVEESQDVLNLLEQFNTDTQTMPFDQTRERDSIASLNVRQAACQWVLPQQQARCRLCCNAENATFADPILVQKIGSKWYVVFVKENSSSE